ncbi:MAG: NDP-sugar synthase [Ilumatobacteraceae bacterium]
MRAVVLVGGFGTRLRPLTSTIPKPMLPVGHVPIIERLVTNLGRSGITEVTLALGFKPEPFVAAFPDGECAGVAMRYAVEPEPLDTAGAIRFAADAAGIDDTFVVVNGDILTDLDVSELVRFHREKGAEATIHLIGVPDPSAFGVVALDADGRVERFVEKPAPGTAPSNLINAGTYVLEPSVLQRIPLGEKVSIERVTFPLVAAAGGLFAMATDDYWIDTGRPELYLQANLDVLAATRRHDRCVPQHESAVVDPAAVIEGSVVGASAQVGAATIRGSVLLPGAVVEAGAVVTDSVLMGRVGAGAVVHNSVLGVDGVVEPGEQVSGERRPDPDAGPHGT